MPTLVAPDFGSLGENAARMFACQTELIIFDDLQRSGHQYRTSALGAPFFLKESHLPGSFPITDLH
jgi:hypothetical protein